jgi:glycosyltransferase involved in cell wall biosynthesis
MRKLPVSVVIVAKNASETIDECLSVIRGNDPSEIIVIDGKSTDNTIEIARKYTDKVYSDEGYGLCYARQLGAEMATQDYLAYIDSDVILLGKDALAIILDEFNNSNFISIRAQFTEDKKCSTYWEWAQHQHNILRTRRIINYFGTNSTLLKRETILKYKFDLANPKMDDMDLGIRLKKEGYKFGSSTVLKNIYYRKDLKSLFKYRFSLGMVTVNYINKYGLWNVNFWPWLSTSYWLLISVVKGKPKLFHIFLLIVLQKRQEW